MKVTHSRCVNLEGYSLNITDKVKYDIVGTPINIGDYVVFRTPNYSGISFGRIEHITPKKVRVKYSNSKINPSILQDQNEVFVITDKDLVARLIIERKIKV